MKKLSASMISRQEKERMAIARELHDELGQILTALRIDVMWIWERLKRLDAKAAERTLAMCELIDKTIDEVRGMSIRLRPGVLDDLGLIPALDWYTADFEKRTGTACTFSHDGVVKVSDAIATAAYRIAQEALTNVARHAGARHVDVEIRRENGLLALSVGVAGMKERANLVGGSLEIHSEPGKGTQVHFRVPVSAEEGGLP